MDTPTTAPKPGPAPMLYLASQSPRRRELLAQWGVSCEALVADPSEDAEALEEVRRGESPTAYVQRVTRNKLHAALVRWAARGLAAAPVLCADTTVALGSQLMGKPADAEHARAMLQALSGRTHRVLTSVAVATPGGPVYQALAVARVRFATLGEAAIARYVASGEPFGKAGAYAIQGAAAVWVNHLSGSHSAVVGLPAHETAQVLAQVGLALPFPPR
jgi:septum formation protein